MGARALLLALLLSCLAGSFGEAPFTSVITHPSTSGVLRDFDLCETVVLGNQLVTIRIGANEAARHVAGLLLQQPHLGANASALDRSLNHEMMAAFLEHRISLAIVARQEVRRYLRHYAKSPVTLVLTRQDCPPLNGEEAETGAGGGGGYGGGSLEMGMSLLNAWRREDWAYYFHGSPPHRIILTDAVVSTLASWPRPAARRLLEHCHAFLSPGGSLDLPARDARAAMQDPSIRVVLGLLGSTPLLPSGPTSFTKAQPPPAHSLAGLLGLQAVLVINLARRPDRWQRMQQQATSLGLPAKSLTRVDATDGERVDLSSPAVMRIFNLTGWRYGGAALNPHQDHAYRPSVLGCALSHIRVWEAIAASPSASPNDVYLVLEDDATLEVNFVDRWRALLPRLQSDHTWRVLWLGMFGDGRMHPGFYGDREVWDGVWEFHGASTTRTYGAGAFAYALRAKGARELVQRVQERGVQQAIDWFLFDSFGDMTCYHLDPPLAHAPSHAKRDSDNDAEYPQIRLLLQKHQQEGLPPPPAALTILHPSDGTDLPADEPLEVRVAVDVAEPAALFAERHKDSRLCVEMRWVSDDEGPAMAQHCTSLSDPRITVTPSEDRGGEAEVIARLLSVDGTHVAEARSRCNVVTAASMGAARAWNATEVDGPKLYEQARAACLSPGLRNSEVLLCMADYVDGRIAGGASL